MASDFDWHDDLSAWSVVARGHLRQLEEDEEHRIESLPLHPWVATLKYDVIELTPESVSGRWFRLQRSEQEPDDA